MSPAEQRSAPRNLDNEKINVKRKPHPFETRYRLPRALLSGRLASSSSFFPLFRSWRTFPARSHTSLSVSACYSVGGRTRNTRRPVGIPGGTPPEGRGPRESGGGSRLSSPHPKQVTPKGDPCCCFWVWPGASSFQIFIADANKRTKAF